MLHENFILYYKLLKLRMHYNINWVVLVSMLFTIQGSSAKLNPLLRSVPNMARLAKKIYFNLI